MKQFFKDNLSLMVRMLVNQLAMTIFGFVLAMACVNSEPLLLLSSVLSIAFYLFLLYFMTYELGQKDGIRIHAGRLAYKPLRGVWVSLCANIPNLVLGILAIIGKLSIQGLGFFERFDALTEAEYAALSPTWAMNLYGACSSIAEFIQCMYKGLCKVLFPGNILTLLIIPLPAIVICGLAYPLGVRYSSGFLHKEDSKERTSRYK